MISPFFIKKHQWISVITCFTILLSPLQTFAQTLQGLAAQENSSVALALEKIETLPFFFQKNFLLTHQPLSSNDFCVILNRLKENQEDLFFLTKISHPEEFLTIIMDEKDYYYQPISGKEEECVGYTLIINPISLEKAVSPETLNRENFYFRLATKEIPLQKPPELQDPSLHYSFPQNSPLSGEEWIALPKKKFSAQAQTTVEGGKCSYDEEQNSPSLLDPLDQLSSFNTNNTQQISIKTFLKEHHKAIVRGMILAIIFSLWITLYLINPPAAMLLQTPYEILGDLSWKTVMTLWILNTARQFEVSIDK